MTTNELLFGVLPYVAITLAVVVSIIRWRTHPFSVSSLSSQLLESRRLYWGSIPFHWGISLILVAHLAALIVPSGFRLWNGAPLRLYALEATGLALALWSAFGIAVLLSRRFTNARVKAVTTHADLLVLAVVAAQIGTGIWVAIAHRWGSFWGVSVVVPYVRSLIIFDPKPEYIDPLPFAVQAHILCFYVFLVIFPFSRLVHIVTLPLGYITRPWQRVVRHSPTPGAYHATSDRPLDKVR